MNSKLKEMFGDWYPLLEEILISKYFNDLGSFIKARRSAFNVEVYPKQEDIFKAFRITPLSKLKVIVIGQDPYYTPGLATGLAFGIPNNEKIPPSLVNILKEVENDIYNGLKLDYDPTLEEWAQQGVLLLNTALTVEKNKPGIHAEQWNLFTRHVLTSLQNKDNLIYLLWGNHAIKYEKLITNPTAFVIKSAHPSPLSAYRGFIGSRPFSKINNQLSINNQTLIKW